MTASRKRKHENGFFVKFFFVKKYVHNQSKLSFNKNGFMISEEFSEAYIKEKSVVVAFIKNKLRSHNAQDALDIYHETWVRYINIRQKTGFELKSKLSTLLIGIADNVIKENNRVQKVQSLDDDAFSIFLEFEDTLTSKKELEELFNLLEKNLTKIGEKCQNIINLFYYEALSHKQIMEQLNFSSPEVSRVSLNRCVDSLRKLSFN